MYRCICNVASWLSCHNSPMIMCPGHLARGIPLWPSSWCTRLVTWESGTRSPRLTQPCHMKNILKRERKLCTTFVSLEPFLGSSFFFFPVWNNFFFLVLRLIERHHVRNWFSTASVFGAHGWSFVNKWHTEYGCSCSVTGTLLWKECFQPCLSAYYLLESG